LAVFQTHWQQILAEKKTQGLYRRLRLLESPQSAHIKVDGLSCLGFCSNDYLGLANHPDIKAAAMESISNDGFGSGASHLVIGHHQQHAMLEQEIAEFTGRERALVFSSGYMANLALVSTLVGKSDVVLHDRLNHASLLDGGLLSGARFQRYLHNDMSRLRSSLEKFSRDPGVKRILVVTDGVFSMDGDIARLEEMSQLCTEFDALLMVDDAHGLGILGHRGKGTLSHLSLSADQVPVLIGTFGKAFGTAGAFVAGSDMLIEYLIQTARPYIYTTAMPPSTAAATRMSLKIVAEAESEREHLRFLLSYFKQELSLLSAGFDVPCSLLKSDTPIQPLVVGDAFKTLEISRILADQGVLVGAIRPPTVPVQTSRLRITFSAAHCKEDVDQLIVALRHAFQKVF
jgi:8-amino-7-oxononanoate synthase